MRDFETDFDFDFGEGLGCSRMRSFRGGDVYHPLTIGGEQVFTPEREARVQAHQKRIQSELRRLRNYRRRDEV